MCGRYTLMTPEDVREIQNIVAEAEKRLKEQHAPMAVKTGEIFPTNLVPILKPETGRLGSYAAFWGFTMHRTRENKQRKLEGKKPLKPKAVFNTRGDKAGTSPFWRDAYHKRRCIVPTTGFFEWQQAQDGKKTEYLFSVPNSPVTYIAGIFQQFKEDASGEWWDHFSMLTTEPSTSVSDIHNRMPVVLLPEEFEQWLHGDYAALLNRQGVALNREAV